MPYIGKKAKDDYSFDSMSKEEFDTAVNTIKSQIQNQPVIWNGIEQVGSSFNAIGANGTSRVLTALNANDIAYIDALSDRIRKYRFDGSSWHQEGNDFLVGFPDNSRAGLTALSEDTVAYVTEVDQEIRTFRFDGTNWSELTVGSSTFSLLHGPVEAINSNQVVVIRSHDTIGIYEFTGSFWTPVVSTVVETFGDEANIALLNEKDVVLANDLTNTIQVYRRDDTGFFEVGQPYQFQSINTGNDMKAINENEIFIKPNTSDNIFYIMRFDGTNWEISLEGYLDSSISSGINSISCFSGSELVITSSISDTIQTLRLNYSLGNKKPHSISYEGFK